MRQSWTEIAMDYRRRISSNPNEPFCNAVESVAALADTIGRAPAALYGWTSMFDLCIQQTDVEPFSGPYLRVMPLETGRVEFRYVDTYRADRQWCREVPPEEVSARFARFLDQLHWVAAGAG